MASRKSYSIFRGIGGPIHGRAGGGIERCRR